MEVKHAKVINAERHKTNEVKLYIQDNGNREYETIRDLLEIINQDREFNKQNGTEEEFLNTPVTLQLTDIEGQEVEGKMCLAVGQLIDNSFVLTGNIDNISFVKED